MEFAKENRVAGAAGQLARVEQDAIETGWLTGYVVAAGPNSSALETVDGSIRSMALPACANWV